MLPVKDKGLDIKSAMTLIVDFARIYSLKHHIWVTNTRDRLMALSEKGVLTAESAGEIVQAYDYLMQIRIENQVRSLERYERPGNFIDPESLTSIDQRMLKEVFNQVRHFQAKLSYDFTGRCSMDKIESPMILFISDVHCQYDLINVQIDHAEAQSDINGFQCACSW